MAVTHPALLGTPPRRGLTGEGLLFPDKVNAADALVCDSCSFSPPKTMNDNMLTPIYEIQGAGHLSPFNGTTVKTGGVVTGTAFRGYYVQDPTGDGDDATSDGLFVFTSSQPTVAVGDFVEIEGGVSEFIPGGADTGNLSVTQISDATTTVVTAPAVFPTPVVIGQSGRVAPSEIVISDDELPANLQEESGNFDPDEDAIDFYESLEGMLVTVEDAVAVSPTRVFSAFSAEAFTLPNQGTTATPEGVLNARGGINLRSGPDNRGDQNPERVQIQFDPNLLPDGFDTPALNVGDALGDVTGVVGYSFGNFEVNVTEPFTITPSGIEQEVTTLSGSDTELTVASYNVLNLSPLEEDDAQRELLAEQIVVNLNAPDIIGLQEIQDNDGTQGGTDSTVTDASETLQALVDAIAAAGGPTYAFADIAPPDDTFGGVPGGNIRNSFLYNPERVSLNEDSLQLITDDAFDGSRQPLVGEFLFNGEAVTVVNNHFSSRFGSTPVFGAIQPFVQAGEDEREAQSQAVNDYVDSLLADDADANVVVLGDLNTFEFTNDLTEILPGTDDERVLTNLVQQAVEDGDAYSFIFDGNSQILDNLYVTDSLLDGAEFEVVHVNNDFARDDGRNLFENTIVASDHEPLLAKLNLAETMEENFTLQLLHLADQEAGVPALETAPNLSAVLSALEDDFENTLKLSSGDAYIPGLFFSASEDAFGGVGRADILIQNELGIQAIVLGNHEFDAGTGVLRDLIIGEVIAEELPLEEAQQAGETPVPDTAAMGSFTASLSGNRLVVTGEFSDLTSALMPVGGVDPAGDPESPIHIHIGEAGTNGPILRNLSVEVEDDNPLAGEFEGEFELTDEQVATLVSDGLYVNLHTMNNPSGELRGQIDIDLENPANYEGTAFPYLSSNLDFTTDENLADLVVPDDQAPQANSLAATTVIDVNGEKVGIVGATTPTLDVISNPGDVTIFPEDFDGNPTEAQLDALAAEIQTDVDELLAANPDVNKVILLSHMQQISIEQALATRLTNVDIIVAGGSNTRLVDETDRLRDGDAAQGEYPIFTTDANGSPVAVVNTDGNYKYVGRLVVDFDENGEIITDSYDPTISGAFATDEQGVAEALANGGEIDPEIQGIVDELQEIIIASESNVFGQSDVYLDGLRGSVRTEETNLGNLTAEANLAIAQETDPSVVISIKNGGGIRDDIGRVVVPAGGTGEPQLLPTEQVIDADGNVVKPEGGISETDIANTLRFNNGLTLLTVTAQELLDIIEHGVGATEEGATPGRFPQVAGVQFSFDASLPEGDRVQSLVVTDENGDDADVIVQNSELVGDASRSFRIVTLGFLAGGGDGYPFPETDRVDLDLEEDAPRTGVATFAPDGTEQDALAEFLADNFGADNPFMMAETDPAEDMRIQNLAFREDTVIDSMTGSGNGGDSLFLVRADGDSAPLFGTDADEFIAGGEGDNSLFGGGGNDTVVGDLDGAIGNDNLYGGAGNDLLLGGMGNDTIGGESGNDTLLGEDGNDVLIGNEGTDILIGGGGSDVFILGAGEGESIITDFESGDVIGLAGGLGAGSLYSVQDGGNTVIGTFSGDLLAVVLNTTVNQFVDSTFISV